MTNVINIFVIDILPSTNRFHYLFVQETSDSFFYHLQPDL